MDRYTSAERLAEQYTDSTRLRIRQETHRRYSASAIGFIDWVIGHLDVSAGMSVADIGCGHGEYHQALTALGAQVTGVDRSLGMARDAAVTCLAVVGDAEALPLGDGTFDRVMCNHVLYHVPDQLLAMRELRRVSRPRGRVVMATNGARNNERIYEVARAAASDIGRPEAFTRASPFRLESVDRVREVFPEVSVHVLRSELVFPDPEPALRYWRTMHDDPELEAAMRARIDAIIEAEDSFRVPTIAGCFVAGLGV